MRRKTPPGFYFVLFLAILAFVGSCGLTDRPMSLDATRELERIPPSGDARVGVYLTSYALGVDSLMEPIYAAQAAGQINTLVINVKNMHGELTYASAVPLAQEIGASTGRVDFASALTDLRERGFYLIARQVLFVDPLLARHLDLEGDWVPCDREIVRNYNLDILSEVATLGFDEIQLDYVRYPDGGVLEDIYQLRFEAVERFVSNAADRLHGRLPLSADLFGRVMWPWNSRKIDPIGQSLEDLAPLLDYISPMVYPSHYYEQSYRDDPYLTIKDALVSGRSRVEAHFRPFLQAFDRHLPDGMSLQVYIEEQVRAAHEHGANGYLFWHPACEYGPLFDVLEPRL